MRKLDPACKFLGLVAMTLVLAFWHHPVLNLAVFALSMVCILCSGVSAKKLLLFLLPILLAALGMFVTGYRFSAGGGMPVNEAMLAVESSRFWNGMTLASRVLMFAGMGYLFALTTDRIPMVRSFQRRFHLPQIFAYGLLAAWGVFPQMMREYRRTRAAFRARGIRVFPVSPALLKPLLVKSVRWSEELAVAMESKGFDGHQKRSEFEPMNMRPADWVFLALTCVAFPVATVLLF